MNLTLKIAHEQRKRINYITPGMTQINLRIVMSENSAKIYCLLDLIRQSNRPFKWFPF